ncbi:MAG: hypothetical protein JW818_09595 [Pirellulales bacterium]|nr:hypothetical protein [Pirellulales bacterium]
MTVTPATVTMTGTQGAQATERDAINDVDLDAFLSLMIAELQNQDPMNPMDNTQMLQQISQIREIGSNDRLSETLDAVLLGQSMSTAANLIGQTVVGLSNANQNVSGRVERISIEDGVPSVHIVQTIEEHYDPDTGDLVPASTSQHTLTLKNISQVLPDDADAALLAQKLSAASTLVGQSIIGVTDAGQIVTGPVTQASIEDGTVKLSVGNYTVDLAQVTHVLQEEDASEQQQDTSQNDTTDQSTT